MGKKRLEDVKDEALEMSKAFPDYLYRVMDKRGERAVCTGSEWVYKERILQGWHTVLGYRNGEEVKV